MKNELYIKEKLDVIQQKIDELILICLRADKRTADHEIETRTADARLHNRVTNLEVWRNSYQS